ncbi:MAG: sigma-54-dependent Fis family transcriptional regulator [Firmicutes bacterium]|nr:sigma-54-dependent Fis family transcriptional regulator [Bacillota bacterium]
MHLEISKEVFFTRDGLLDTILDSTFDQAIIVDKNERIIFFSKSSQAFSGKTPKQLLGKKISEEVPNHRFSEILRSGVAEKNTLTVIRDMMAVTHHIPVKDNGEIIGAIGIVTFNSLSTVNKLVATLATNHNKDYSDLYDNIARHQSSYTFSDYIGNSEIVKRLLDDAKRFANSNYPVLIIGETGTGKEILANAIHAENKRTFNKPFVKINCSAIPNNLLESELFGHEKGAFTGASAKKIGKFEMAHNGSILLDEIGEMDLVLQTKLLRVLEEREFERVGGNKLIPTNARIIASTNANLPNLCHQKKFREDLYYRLSTLEIHVPPLRNRLEDIPLLVDHFICSESLNIKFNRDALQALMNYSWPGNIRQLKNIINRFGVMNNNHLITQADVSAVLHKVPSSESSVSINNLNNSPPSNAPALAQTDLESIEKSAIIQVLRQCNFNQVAAAKKLHIARTTLIRKIKKYKITPETY